MSDAPDKESRTEEPTHRRLEDAIERGNLPISREATIFGSLLAMLALFAFAVPDAVAALVAGLSGILRESGTARLDSLAGGLAVLSPYVSAALLALLPVFVILSAGGLAGSLLQNPPGIAAERLKPSWSKISPLKGWSRIFGIKGLAEFLRSLIKLAIAAATIGYAALAEFPEISMLMTTQIDAMPGAILAMAIRLLAWSAAIFLFFTAGDLVLSRFLWRHGLRMTRHEVKEEAKQSDGNPLIKGKIRSEARRRASRRMMADVPKSTVVIANPTHYAIALRYKRDEHAAPVVLAKGVDNLAIRIKEAARRHGIDIIEDRALARALYGAADVGALIPEEFFRPVAEIIFFVQKAEKARQDRPSTAGP